MRRDDTGVWTEAMRVSAASNLTSLPKGPLKVNIQSGRRSSNIEGLGPWHPQEEGHRRFSPWLICRESKSTFVCALVNTPGMHKNERVGVQAPKTRTPM